MKLRGDDPAGMKNFIMNVQSRVIELKATSGDGQSNLNNKRVCSFCAFRRAFITYAS